MAGVLLGAVVIAVLALYFVARTGRALSRIWFLGVLWRWHTGVSRSERTPRPKLAAYRSGVTLLVVVIVAGLLASPRVTIAGLAAGVAGGLIFAAVWLVRWVYRFRHGRSWLRPAHLAACDVAQIPRGRPPASWLEVARDRSWATAWLPPGWPADDRDKQRLVAILVAKLGMESPDREWRLAGPKPYLKLTAAEPSPPEVLLPEIRPEIEAARHDELVWGRGKRGLLVKNSLSGDSPHWGLSMGSGAGKSWTIRALVAQALYHGAISLILDPKMLSHQWADGLPNVAIYRRPHELHAALLWLGDELQRRNEVALAGADMDGNVHASVGPRIMVVAEELNAMAKMLRKYWDSIREPGDPKRSPALDALDLLSFMGRQVLCNVLYVAQRLSVRAGGGDGDARENIGVIAFGRYTPSNWKMLAGDHAMPPKSLKEGRLQIVATGVTEVQCVKMYAREARELALAGKVSPLPAGMPGAKRVPGETHEHISGADLPFVSETRAPVLEGPALVTLSEAVELRIVNRSLHALRKASQRDPDFPQRQGNRGLAAEYEPVELSNWDAARR